MGQVLKMEISWKTNLPLFSMEACMYRQRQIKVGVCVNQWVKRDEVQDTRKDCMEKRLGKRLHVLVIQMGQASLVGSFFSNLDEDVKRWSNSVSSPLVKANKEQLYMRMVFGVESSMETCQ